MIRGDVNARREEQRLGVGGGMVGGYVTRWREE
jgi:hypothetical protein